MCGLLRGKSSSTGDPDSTPQRVFTSVCRSASLSDDRRNGEIIDSYPEIYIHMSIQCINAQIHTNTYFDSKWASLSNMEFYITFNFNVHRQKDVLPNVYPKKNMSQSSPPCLPTFHLPRISHRPPHVALLGRTMRERPAGDVNRTVRSAGKRRTLFQNEGGKLWSSWIYVYI